MQYAKPLSKADNEVLEKLYEKIQLKATTVLGYPVAMDFDYSPLYHFLQYPINNIGDPFIESTYGISTREMEKDVLDFFANLFRAEPNEWWGYITNGGSEGNMYGLYLGRELFPKAMVYYSESTHYSVQKNLHLLDMPNIAIRTKENGEIDYDDLHDTIRMNRNMPVIVFANIGTTMTEARDDVKRIKEIFRDLAIHHHYIHADGALSGSYSPFVEPKPAFDFADGVDSIAISGHKFIGSPIPCGIVLAKKTHRDRIANSVAYVGSPDTTISGSRNGITPLFLWYAIKRYGIDGFRLRTEKCLQVASYAEDQLNKIGLNAWRNINAITVIFGEIDKELRNKWQLATANGNTHLICMPGVTEKRIDLLVKDIEESIAGKQ
jgi:histidine decarboxylase